MRAFQTGVQGGVLGCRGGVIGVQGGGKRCKGGERGHIRGGGMEGGEYISIEYISDIISEISIDDRAAFKQEIILSSKYGFEFEYSKYTLHLLAGEQFRGDFSEFQALGVNLWVSILSLVAILLS